MPPPSRRETTNNPLHWKSNNRETSFRKATISTPIEQTRFLLVIKLSLSLFRPALRFRFPKTLRAAKFFVVLLLLLSILSRTWNFYDESRKILSLSLSLRQTLRISCSIHASSTRSCLRNFWNLIGNGWYTSRFNCRINFSFFLFFLPFLDRSFSPPFFSSSFFFFLLFSFQRRAESIGRGFLSFRNSTTTDEGEIWVGLGSPLSNTLAHPPPL